MLNRTGHKDKYGTGINCTYYTLVSGYMHILHNFLCTLWSGAFKKGIVLTV